MRKQWKLSSYHGKAVSKHLPASDPTSLPHLPPKQPSGNHWHWILQCLEKWARVLSGKSLRNFWVAGWKSAKVFKTSWTWQCLKPIMKCFHWLGIFENWKNLNGLIMCKCLMQQNNLAAAFASPKKYHWEVFPSMQSSKQENNWVNAVFQEVRMGSEPKNRSSQPKIIFPLVSRVKRAAAPGWGRTRKACKI